MGEELLFEVGVGKLFAEQKINIHTGWVAARLLI